MSLLAQNKNEKNLYIKTKQADVSLETDLRLSVQILLRQSHIFSIEVLHGYRKPTELVTALVLHNLESAT